MQGSDADHRQAARECESLRDAAGNAQARERAGPGAEGDGIQLGGTDS
jgi:hypothetical protein